VDEETKKKVKLVVGVVVVLIVLRIFVVNFISLFDHMERHGIKGPADRQKIELANKKHKK